jgi:hypothetical protein
MEGAVIRAGDREAGVGGLVAVDDAAAFKGDLRAPRDLERPANGRCRRRCTSS